MIYFITDGEYVKIGYTDQDDALARLNSLQIGNARELKLIGCIEGGRATEQILHLVFHNLRIRGEWFLASLPDNSSEESPIELPRSSSLTEQGIETRKKICALIAESPDISNGSVGRRLGLSRQRVGQIIKEMANDDRLLAEILGVERDENE